MFFDRRRKKALEEREHEIEVKDRELKILFLNMILEAKKNSIKGMDNILDAIK